MSQSSPVNLIFDEKPLRQTPWERNKNLVYYQLRDVRTALKNTAFEITIDDLNQADPDNLLKVFIKNKLNFVIFK